MYQTNGIIGKNFQAMKYLQIFSKQWIFIVAKENLYFAKRSISFRGNLRSDFYILVLLAQMSENRTCLNVFRKKNSAKIKVRHSCPNCSIAAKYCTIFTKI